MRNNSITLYDEALALWHSDNHGTRLLFTGDFSTVEIQTIVKEEESDLLVRLLIAKADMFESISVLKVRAP